MAGAQSGFRCPRCTTLAANGMHRRKRTQVLVPDVILGTELRVCTVIAKNHIRKSPADLPPSTLPLCGHLTFPFFEVDHEPPSAFPLNCGHSACFGNLTRRTKMDSEFQEESMLV